MREVVVAVVGTGSAGMRHLAALHQLSGVRPMAVPRRPERVGELTEQGEAAVQTLREAAERGAALCIIATDTGRHVEDGLEALGLGLDLLVEKPLAVSAADASRLVERAAQTGRRLFVGCTLRCSESLNGFRSLLKELGAVHAVRIECQSYLPDWRPGRPYQSSYAARPEEGGVLLDLIHEIDYATWLFGRPTAVQARLRNLGRLGIAEDEAAELIWEAPAGGVVSVSLDYLTRPSRRSMRAVGERGSLEWDGMSGTVSLALAGEPERIISSAQTRDEMFLAQARAFVSASQGTVDPRLATGDDGVQALAVCDAARRASASRREEPVHEPARVP